LETYLPFTDLFCGRGEKTIMETNEDILKL